MALRKMRLTGLYGLMSAPWLRSACSGLTPRNAPPISAVHSASRARSPVSPIPQFSALRTEYRLAMTPKTRSCLATSATDGHWPGTTMSDCVPSCSPLAVRSVRRRVW
jgi:hypothetical protein